MNQAEHRKKHKELHQALDELLAEYVRDTGDLPSETTVLELAKWSHEQFTRLGENETKKKMKPNQKESPVEIKQNMGCTVPLIKESRGFPTV